MFSLFSYVVAVDLGSAPNPYWGVCTLVICKPGIRRTATIGDWVVGFGSKHSPLGDMRRRVVYAMRVTHKMAMGEYDAYVRERVPGKIPVWGDADPRKWVGDAIYDFSSAPARLRQGVHGEDSRTRDLAGKYALLSEHYYYFGDHPRRVPPGLHGMVPSGQGHRSVSNDYLRADFLRWLRRLKIRPNRLHGLPANRLAVAAPDPDASCEPSDPSEPACRSRGPSTNTM